MLELDKLFEDYLPNSEQIVGGVKTRRKLTSWNELPVDNIITKDLPRAIEQFVSDSGRDVKKYRVYGSVGQLNWTLAYIPWGRHSATRHHNVDRTRLLRCFAV